MMENIVAEMRSKLDRIAKNVGRGILNEDEADAAAELAVDEAIEQWLAIRPLF